MAHNLILAVLKRDGEPHKAMKHYICREATLGFSWSESWCAGLYLVPSLDYDKTKLIL